MPKLPPNFVKAPAAKARSSKAPSPKAEPLEAAALAPKPRASRPGKLSLVEPLTDNEAREVLVRLTDEQYRALQEACAELRLQGQMVTVEEMVQRVVAGWMANTANLRSPEEADDGVVAHLIRFAQSPVQRWRELGAALRRLPAALRAVRA